MNKTATLLCILCVMLVTSNAFLLYTNHRLTTQHLIDEAEQLPTLNAPITPIKVHDKQGRQHSLEFKTDARHAHLVLVMSPDCPYCKKNWPMWDKLLREEPSNVDVIYFDVTGKFDKQVSKAHNINDEQIVTASLDSAIRAHFVGTPTTILIASNGNVQHVWAGVLDEGQLGEILAMARRDAIN